MVLKKHVEVYTVDSQPVTLTWDRYAVAFGNANAVAFLGLLVA